MPSPHPSDLRVPFFPALLAILAALLLAAPARAAPSQPAGAVAVYAEGPEQARVLAALSAVLAPPVRQVSGDAFVAALKKEGLKPPLKMDLFVPRKRKLPMALLRNAATACGATAAIIAKSVKRAKKITVAVLLADPRAPEPVISAPLVLSGDADKDKQAVRELLAAPLAPLLGGGATPVLATVVAAPTAVAPAAAAPAAATPAGAATPVVTPNGAVAPAAGAQAEGGAAGGAGNAAAPVAAGATTVAGATGSEGARPASDGLAATRSVRHGDRATALVEGEVGFEIGGRRFSYSDGLTANLPDYSVFGAPMLVARVSVFPAAWTGIRVLRDFGLDGYFGHAFGLSSAPASGTTIDTDWTRAGGALRYRLLVPRTGPVGVLAGAAVGVDWQRFTFDASGDLAKLVAAAEYLAVRAGLSARVSFWRLAFLADGAFLAPLSSGPVYERFRDPSVFGVDIGAGVAYALPRGFEVALRARYTRYFSAFHPVPGDAYVAGGALDEYITFGGGVSYAY